MDALGSMHMHMSQLVADHTYVIAIHPCFNYQDEAPHLHVHRHMMRTQAVTIPAQQCPLPR
jgi:hypothetical protein